MADGLAPTFGIEEEFFLVDPHSRDLVSTPPDGFLGECRRRVGDRVHEEMQAPQVEVATPVLHDAAAAREALTALRAGVGGVASAMGMRLVAAGTHPMAIWTEQTHTARKRYEQLIDDFQIVGRRNLLCGLHVHVGVPAAVDRVQLMNRLMPWLPVFLGVSTSSPFWNRRRTGLLSYRQTAYDEWPRSGIPDAFADEAEYTAFIDLLARCDALRDGSFLWWAIRPSIRFPTLELRIADACTRIEDALAIAAAFRCLVRAHLRQPELGQQRSALTRRVIDENRWQVKRHGTRATLIDEHAGEPLGFAGAIERLCALVAEDAQAMDCEDELAHLARIVRTGTSAHMQLAIHARERSHGRSRVQALQQVVDWLADTTTDALPNHRAAAGAITAPPLRPAC